MREHSAGEKERHERLVTVAFVILGALFLLAAVYGTFVGLADLQLALAAAEERPPSRVVMHELNREILAAFVGAVFFASGVLRWRD